MEEKKLLEGPILTAFDSFDCKFQIIQKGYYQDPTLISIYQILQQQYGWKGGLYKRPPIINHGYYVRIRTFQYYLQKFLNQTNPSITPTTTTTGSRQFVFIGAGYDSTPFNLMQANNATEDNNHTNTTNIMIEIDFQEIIERKVAIYTQLAKEAGEEEGGVAEGRRGGGGEEEEEGGGGRESYQWHRVNHKIYRNRNHFLFIQDLNDSNHLIEELLTQCQLSVDNPTVIVSECVLVYLKQESITRLIQQFAQSFRKCCWFSYDVMNANDLFGQRMLKNIHATGVQLPGFIAFPTLDSQQERFRSNGWTSVTVKTMLEKYHDLSEAEKAAMNDIERLDEWEEWNLLLSHYSFTIATNNFKITD